VLRSSTSHRQANGPQAKDNRAARPRSWRVQICTGPHKCWGWRALKMLAVEKDTTLNALAVEAFNDLLKKHGKRQSVENPLLD
jgi:hypothetical protein